MLRTLELKARKYPSIGRCIFCGSQDNLTREHIVPEFLSGINELVIDKGSCRDCNQYANTSYEQRAAQADFLPIRILLALKRKRRGKSDKVPTLPPVSVDGSWETASDDSFIHHLALENYPPIAEFVMQPPPGLLCDIDRSAGSTEFRVLFLQLPQKGITPPSATFRHRHTMGDPEMVIAKMAYCYAVAEKGFDFADMTELCNLLRGVRNDVFNFVGAPVETEYLHGLRLHQFHFRRRGKFSTVLVHLFASFGGPVYEVVLGPAA